MIFSLTSFGSKISRGLVLILTLPLPSAKVALAIAFLFLPDELVIFMLTISEF